MLRRAFLLLMLGGFLAGSGVPTSAQPPPEVWKTYHDYAALTQTLRDLAAKFPERCKLESLGKTEGGRDVWAVTVTNFKDKRAKLPLLFDGSMHGSEAFGGESVLAYLRCLVEQYATDATAKGIVDSCVTYLIPMVNPDGVERGKATAKGKEARCDGQGVNLNRNFQWHFTAGGPDKPGSPDYRGPSAFSEKESRYLRDFILTRKPLLYLNAHTGTDNGPYLIAPRDSDDAALIATIARAVQKEADYPTVYGALGGEAMQWAYRDGMKSYRTAHRRPLAFVLEIYTDSDVTTGSRKWWNRYAPPPAQYDAYIKRARTVFLTLTRITQEQSLH